MSIVAADLLQPNGPVTAKLFPGLSKTKLTTQLTAYIARAAADSRVVDETNATKKDPITRALALYYTFNDVYIRMSAEPISVNVTEKGSTGYNMAQIDNMRALAQGYLDEAIGLVTVAISTTRSTSNAAIPNRFTF